MIANDETSTELELRFARSERYFVESNVRQIESAIDFVSLETPVRFLMRQLYCQPPSIL